MTADKTTTEPTAPGTAASPSSSLIKDVKTEPVGAPGPDLSAMTHEELEKRVKALTDDLAQANAEAESFRQQWEDLRLRDEALGVEALTVDDQKLEDKVVQAVRELYQSEMKRREAVQILNKLVASTDEIVKTAPHESPQTRADYEVASRIAKDYLAGRNGAAIPLGVSLADGRIADLNPELNAVILNLGKSQGAKEGMPFVIYQDNVEIGTVKIVLARDLISAALVESVKPKAVLKVGDRAIADVRE